MRPLRNLILIALLSSLGCLIASCSDGKEPEALDRAEAVIESAPDSALTILTTIDPDLLKSNRLKARFALLMSMALDKNYIDTTSFEVLQPAIDYYTDHGSPDQKLKTYYYQGRIYQNRGDRDHALDCYVNAIDFADECRDSICIARALVAQGVIYNDFYDFGSYADCFLHASDIYSDLSRPQVAFDCLLNALNGYILTHNKAMCDSTIQLCENINLSDIAAQDDLYGYKLSYSLKFGTNEELDSIVAQSYGKKGLDINCRLNLASALNRLGKNRSAMLLLDSIKSDNIGYDTLKYQAVLFPILKDLGDYESALASYQDFSHRIETENAHKFKQKAQSFYEKRELELKAHKDNVLKIRIIWGCIVITTVLAMGVIILLLLVRSNRTKRELALEKVRAHEAENDRLKSKQQMLELEKNRLALENQNLQLERDYKALEAENLALRVVRLENEIDALKALTDHQDELPEEVHRAIQVRIEMLNSLLASYITANDQYGKPYDAWVKELTENTAEFMNSNRLAFQATHPRFIQYFEEHNLTVDEINYVCLYAIGLRGKEVGNYMKKRSHVNTSSAIRKKLGIDKHETNIGIYVRKLLKNL